MIARLHEANACEPLAVRALHNGLHELAPDAVVLHFRIDRDWADARYATALVEKIAADDLATELGDNSVEAGITDQHGKEAGRDLWAREVRWEIMFAGDRGKRLVTNWPGRCFVTLLCDPNLDAHGSLPQCRA